jgi:uncharacterized membrane protein
MYQPRSVDILKINAAIMAGLLILLALIPEFLSKIGTGEEAAIIVVARFIFLIFAWISSILASMNLFRFFSKRTREVVGNNLDDIDRNHEGKRLLKSSYIIMVMGFCVVLIFSIVTPFITSNILEELLTTHQIHLGK